MASNAASLSLVLLEQQKMLRDFFTHWIGSDGWEDAYHSLWLKLQNVHETPPIEDMRGFLFYLARLVALDHGRGEARRRRLQKNISDILWGDIYGLSADDVAIARDELRRVRAAADRLPEPTRTIFALNRMENLTHREISERVGLSQNTIAKHIRKALGVLNSAINEEAIIIS
jgi:RNA polymerase sigma factor (sigma-70 family)